MYYGRAAMRPMYSPSTQCNRNQTSLPHNRHCRPNHHAHELPPHLSTQHPPILRKRYNTQNHVRRRLPCPTKSMQLCGHALPPWLAQQRPHQWTHRHLVQNNQKHRVLSSRSRNRRHLVYGQQTCLLNAYRPQRTRPPPTHHRIPFQDRQQHCPRHPHFQNAPKTFQIFWHALLVAAG